MPAIVKRDIPGRIVKQVSGLDNLQAVFEVGIFRNFYCFGLSLLILG